MDNSFLLGERVLQLVEEGSCKVRVDMRRSGDLIYVDDVQINEYLRDVHTNAIISKWYEVNRRKAEDFRNDKINKLLEFLKD